MLPDGTFRFDFADSTHQAFTVSTTTNAANLLSPPPYWTAEGVAQEFSPGLYVVRAPLSSPQRFYKLLPGLWLQEWLPCWWDGPNPCPACYRCAVAPGSILGVWVQYVNGDCCPGTW